MVRFNPLLCLGVPTQCQRFQFYRGPWGLWFYRDFMLNTALRTSQQRVLGTAILQWDMFSLDVCHVLQFYREVLAEPISHNNSLIILDHPWSSCIFWNHLESWHIFGNFWILLGYIGDLLEIHHQGFISYHQLYSANMYNFIQFWHFNILQKQFFLVYKL